MNQRNRQPFTRPADRPAVPSAVRVIGPEKVPAASAAEGRTSAVVPRRGPISARPEHYEELPEVVDHLRAGRAVLLQLEGFVDRAARRQGLAFVSGAACAFGITVARSGTRRDEILLDPSAVDGERVGNGEVAARESADRADTCVLCDLRTADREVHPPLEMVIKRDGSRIWSPPAMVCSHCRQTIRHWKFVLAWCPQCERWGRRNVVSPCGQLYD